MIFDIIIVIVFGTPETTPMYNGKLNQYMFYVLTALPTDHLHIYLPLSRPPYFLWYISIKIRPFNNGL